MTHSQYDLLQEKEVYSILMQRLVDHPLYAHVKQGMYQDMLRDVEDILAEIHHARMSPQASVNVIHHMLLLAYRAAHESGVSVADALADISFQGVDASRFASFSSLREYIIDWFQQLVVQCQTKTCNRNQTLAMKMKQYIDEHYSEHITLTSLAHHFNISPSYLSLLFREHTSSNFIDYLTSVRIHRAKELLASSDLRVYEIAESIGYRDAHYFSAAFKKIVGISPTEYRERYSNNGQ